MAVGAAPNECSVDQHYHELPNAIACLAPSCTASRVAELEGLLAGMRAREFRSELSVDKSGSQLAMLEQRNRLLEEQVRTVSTQSPAATCGVLSCSCRGVN